MSIEHYAELKKMVGSWVQLLCKIGEYKWQKKRKTEPKPMKSQQKTSKPVELSSGLEFDTISEVTSGLEFE